MGHSSASAPKCPCCVPSKSEISIGSFIAALTICGLEDYSLDNRAAEFLQDRKEQPCRMWGKSKGDLTPQARSRSSFGNFSFRKLHCKFNPGRISTVPLVGSNFCVDHLDIMANRHAFYAHLVCDFLIAEPTGREFC